MTTNAKACCAGEPHTCDQEAIAAAESRTDRAIIEREQLRAEVDRLTKERDEALDAARRSWQDRYDALNVRSAEGLLSSEWLLRTGKAERERDAARAECERMRPVFDAACNLVNRRWLPNCAETNALVAAVDAARAKESK